MVAEESSRTCPAHEARGDARVPHRPVHVWGWRWRFQGRKSKPEEHDEHLVALVDGSHFPPSGCKVKKQRRVRISPGSGNRSRCLTGDASGGVSGVVRENKDEESEVTCESDGISEETTNFFGDLTAIQKLMQSCQDLKHAWLTVREDCTFCRRGQLRKL